MAGIPSGHAMNINGSVIVLYSSVVSTQMPALFPHYIFSFLFLFGMVYCVRRIVNGRVNN